MTAKKPTADVTAADTTATGAATDTTQPDPTQPEERQPLPVPEGGWPADEYTGVAGTFVRDPYTGIRTPLAE